MSVLVQRHLDAIAASMALLNAQIEALRHASATEATPPPPRIVAPERPARCRDVAAARCALVDADARKPRGSFGSPNRWRCVGCGHDGDTAPVGAG